MPDFSLPSGPPVTHFTGFYRSARFNAKGEAEIIFSVPRDMIFAVTDLATAADGLALNVTVERTEMEEGDQALARLLGIGVASGAEAGE